MRDRGLIMWAYTKDKKNEYWDHMISFIHDRKNHYKKLTERRLQMVKQELWNDDDFWFDILICHGGNWNKPGDCRDYSHMIGNMIRMVIKCFHELCEKM
jgi:hypothetical protein